MQKSDVLHSLCSGSNEMSSSCGRDVFIALEKGKLGAKAPQNPILNPPLFCSEVKSSNPISKAEPTEKKRNSVKSGMSGGCGCGKKKK